MLDKFRRFFKKDEQNKLDEKYILIPKSEINEELKRNIIELEKLGEECSKVLQKSMKMYSKSRENPI